MIVGMAGYKRVGKDTAAEVLVTDFGFDRYALADPLKQAVSALFGFAPEEINGEAKDLAHLFWNITPRQALQVVGTELIRNELRKHFPHITNLHIERMKQEARLHDDLVITDVRFPDEVEAVQDLGGIVIRIHRPGYEASAHPSETLIDTAPVDYEVINDASKIDLQDRIVAIVSGAMTDIGTESALVYPR